MKKSFRSRLRLPRRSRAAPDRGSGQLKTSAPTTVAGRVDALNAIFASYWEDQLKYNPEFASSLGDKRYDDQLTDYSVTGV
jgi:hypothetical protein